MDVKRCFLLSLVLALAAVAVAQQDPVSTVKRDLAGWKEIMEMFIMDDGHYPEVSSIEALAYEVLSRQYAEQVVVGDPTGRPYRVSSTRNHYRISTADGIASIENRFKEPEVKAAPKLSTSPASITFPTPRSPDTTLYVTKSGDDIRLDWSGTGTQYDGAMGTDPRFSYVRTLFLDSTATSYFYKNGLLKYEENFLCFDVTDEVEVNHGGYWYGGVLPPAPPFIDAGSPSTTIGSLYVGSTGTIVGTGFSTNPAENFICFDGGICIPATTATTTQVQFTTPPGAVSGGLTVYVHGQTSDPETAFVTLEDPAVGWNIRTIGFSPLTGEYWMAGNYSTVNSIYRVYYNSGTKKWVKSDQKGGMAAQILYCSGKTTRTGRLLCGYGLNSAAGGTRYVDTSPVGTLTTCIGLGGSGANVNVRGAAADPNPDAVGGRDVAYFAFADTGASSYRIKKVAADCSSVLDADYGNYNWSGTWGSIVGMTVDQVTGDLYVASTTNVYKIDSSETITAVKGGFTTIYDLDLFRQSPGDPGFLLIADAGTAGAGSLKAIALDNTAAAPITVSSVSNMRAATWGASVFSQANVIPGNIIRRVVVHNNSNSGAVNPIRPHPLVVIKPDGPSDLWMAAASPEGGSIQGPPAQAYTRLADPSNAAFSRGEVIFWYKDDKARETCAYMGDPGKAPVPYEPAPADPDLCDKPCKAFPCTLCDNKDFFAPSGVGTFQDTGLTSSCKTCGSLANKCLWEFRITKRYGGDNYRPFIQTADSSTQPYFSGSGPPYTAGKHVHFENDRMGRKGGILAQDFNGASCVPWVAGDPLCEAVPDPANLKCNELRVFDWVNLQAEDPIKLFDSSNPYETTTQTAIYNSSINRGDGTSIICLKNAGGNGVNLQGTFLASASGPDDNRAIDFSVGKSAGVCLNSANDADFYIADASDLRQAFDDSFASFHVTPYGSDGAGVVPYLPQSWFDSNDLDSKHYFSRIWFSHFIDSGSGTPRLPRSQNYFHLVGAGSAALNYGMTSRDYDWTFILVQRIEDIFGASAPLANRDICAHECAHHWGVNPNDCARHDTHQAWCGGEVDNSCGVEMCTMNLSRDRTNGVFRFCSDDLLLGAPDTGSKTCGVPPNDWTIYWSLGEGAIRTMDDPR